MKAESNRVRPRSMADPSEVSTLLPPPSSLKTVLPQESGQESPDVYLNSTWPHILSCHSGYQCTVLQTTKQMPGVVVHTWDPGGGG